MLRSRIIPLSKFATSPKLIGSTKIEFPSTKMPCVLAPCFLSQQRMAQTKAMKDSFAVARLKATVSEKYYWIKDKIYYHAVQKYAYRKRGYMLYRFGLDNLDYLKFMKEYNMPDTFYSWFLVTELHIWILMVRLGAVGRDGLYLKINLVSALWQDTDVRKKKLGASSNQKLNEQMQELGHQFKAAITGYDEGLLGGDANLAGAVWRRLLQMNCNNPEVVEKLVKYIRQTICEFDKLPHEYFTSTSYIKWVDFQVPDYKKIDL